MALHIDDIYRQYLHLVRAQARRILRDDRDVDDVVQNVFIKYWQRYGQDPVADPAGLLFCMATHQAIGILRQRQRRSRRESGAVLHGGATPPSVDIDALSLLSVGSPQDAAVAACYYLGGLSQDEIADALAMKRHEVKHRLERFGKVLGHDAQKHGWYVEVRHAIKR